MVFSAHRGDGKVVYFRCKGCDRREERPSTPAERRWFSADTHSWNRSSGLHAVWHEFARRFKRQVVTGTGKIGKKTFKYTQEVWRWIGYELMQRVAKWAVKYPDDVRITSCDDNHFSSSDLVLIEHKTRDRYMGTTVVYVPQCSGEQPIDFFLYPSHRHALIKTLQAIGKVAAVVERRERAVERAHRSTKPRSLR
jgi:hypothetical protein